MSKAVANLTQLNETITFSAQDNGETINVKINELARGPAGADGPNSVTSATTSDGTANLSLSNVTTATATVTGTLTADHIHGNLAGSVYAHVRAGENLAKGDPVYISGSHGTGANLIAIVSKADASDPLKMPAVGVMDAAVANNATGHMVITGTISDINTATYSVNAELYVAEGGGFTATPPNAYAQPVARVERSNTNNGAVIVKVNGLSAISPTASTLVRRDSSGVSDFNTINLGDLHTGGSPSAPYGSIGKSVLTGSSGVGISGNPDVALEAATHRITLSSSGIALTSGTITTSQPLSLTQTWNAGAVTFKGIDVNITDTASASGSLLMDLRVGGVSRFNVRKDGTISFKAGANTADISSDGAGRVLISASSTAGARINGDLQIGSTSTILLQDAANTLAQRNGTNAQEFRLYGTTNAGVTEYERLKLKYNSTTLSYQIGTEKGGTTTSARALEFQTDGTTRMTIGSTGTITYSASQTGFFDISKTAQTGRESILRAKVSDSGNDAFHIYNATSVNNSFAPGFSGSRFSSNLFCVGFIAQTNSSNDNGTSPLMLFESRITDSESDPNNGNLSPISNRPLFAWQTFNSEKMRMLANGNLALGATTAASRLTITGGDAEVTDSASGVILKSPDGTRYRITVANGGTLTVTAA